VSESATTPIPKLFTIVGGIALVWNLIGLMVFVSQVTISDAAMAELHEDQQLLFNSLPSWVNVAFGVAVIGGTLGCLALLVKKSLALPLFLLSLLGVLAQNYHYFFMSNAVEVFGVQAVAMPSMVIVIGVLLIMLAARAKAKGWLR